MMQKYTGEKEITHIIDIKHIPKIDKYIVKLGFYNETAKEIWMSDRQLSQLEALFEKTENGYSSKAFSVIGVWNEKGYYAYSRYTIEKEDEFSPPMQQDLSDLVDD